MSTQRQQEPVLKYATQNGNEAFSSIPGLPAWSFQGVTNVGCLPPPCSPDPSDREPGGPPYVTPWNDGGLPPVTQKRRHDLFPLHDQFIRKWYIRIFRKNRISHATFMMYSQGKARNAVNPDPKPPKISDGKVELGTLLCALIRIFDDVFYFRVPIPHKPES